ncbi:hypothetical protein GLOTRDRAFT_132394 [Gloeophyllum trabeum ATCC 11539]|uniref:Uncharacterized protein n=1 Tax=Gloeophyllum trabeum (strain ATCC 11539 / FP-39264 / Madison 617) TaxID=670483 RepID=S7RDH9_GLOTA|nr:uncharacterized protein GLOTRDRAFT_132394 [Gloeophyllum trabeum ATCC 11539]EPQ52275.1 hypothetical protein GLOTRDRAFT_132394 [Gloeophyllum trabeum ATCC 11539]
MTRPPSPSPPSAHPPPRTLLTYNDTGPSNSAQYLYGFTITFIALFVAFAMCAYSSRRGRWRRDMRVMHWTDPVPLPSADEGAGGTEQERECERPVYAEVWIRGRDGTWGWADVKPLSATLRTPSPPPLDPVAARVRRLNPYLRPPSEDPDRPRAAQVSLLLSMPCPREGHMKGIGDVVLGVARVGLPGG